MSRFHSSCGPVSRLAVVLLVYLSCYGHLQMDHNGIFSHPSRFSINGHPNTSDPKLHYYTVDKTSDTIDNCKILNREVTSLLKNGRSKVNLSLCLTKCTATKTYGEVEVELHAFLYSALGGGEWSASRPGWQLYHQRKSLL
jgi:hypothetical protein